MKKIEMLIAAPASNTGKTAVTCGLLAALRKRGKDPVSFKCGPDYIDPMFHRSVLGVACTNLDLFLADQDYIRESFRKRSEGHKSAVIEGVMGFYDGLGGSRDTASSWHLSDTLDVPVLLVVRPKGASLSLAAMIRGFLQFRESSHIRGIFLNDCKESLYKMLAPMLERETGIPVIGYLPHMEEAVFGSRHLGLYTAAEISDLQERIGAIARKMEETVDWERLEEVFGAEKPADDQIMCDHIEADLGDGLTGDDSAAGSGLRTNSKVLADGADDRRIPEVTGDGSGETEVRPRIAVARDEAFCFIYAETLDALEEAGAELVYFSPLKDSGLPENVQGLYLPGGYPELHLQELSENESMRESVRHAVAAGVPTVAECGGYMYLGRAMTEQGVDGQKWPMCGVLDFEASMQNRLIHFGYANLTPKEDSLLFAKDDVIPIHEFHYWNVDREGADLTLTKPLTGRSHISSVTRPTLYAGFPHIYFAGHPELVQRWISACKSCMKK